MRRIICWSVLAGLALINVGCIGVVTNKGAYCGPCRKQVVAMNGTIYIVDARSGGVRRLDADAVAQADIVTRTEVTVTETVTPTE